MVSGDGGGGDSSEHVHEGTEERGRQEVTACRQELIQADLPVGGPVGGGGGGGRGGLTEAMI